MILLLACATAFDKSAPPFLDVQVDDFNVVAGAEGMVGSAHLSMSSNGTVTMVQVEAVDLVEDNSSDVLDSAEVVDTEHALPWDQVYEWSMDTAECGVVARFGFEIRTDHGSHRHYFNGDVTCAE